MAPTVPGDTGWGKAPLVVKREDEDLGSAFETGESALFLGLAFQNGVGGIGGRRTHNLIAPTDESTG